VASTANELGGALGIAVIGSIATAAYRDRIADTMPAAVPAQAVGNAETSLGDALGEALKLPGAVGGRLVDAAQGAFAHGMAVGSVVAIGVLLVLAALVAFVLRGVELIPDDAPAAAAPDTTERDDVRAGLSQA
jgi:DHA2 family multidrug resistance protein-like MFS transporter